MIIDIGTGVDESVVKWKYNDKDKWRDADIDELIHLYESVVHCKDCRYSRVYQTDSKGTMQTYCVAFVMSRTVTDDDFCSWGERRKP